ncbi:enamine deaminase RidA (YjgF/YER057c/UK114 family) [Mycoplana sp. BE70]|uniref:RidA family protein n=1 Tax=Mycoplana sp. BE70 TaxID=2817775 RepID=UPI00285B0A19|nr:RidA family protein [Mycoplana sp. BE70]MDR6759391.1 enamine deaminase RidA (YjgF/YER057c/UK114 family) [Mycoplana sp. BE70]
MTNHPGIFFLADTDEDALSADVTGFGDLLMTSQIPLRPDGSLELGDIEAQSECTLASLKASLEKCGSGLESVLHLTIYFTDMADRPAFNEVYRRFFKKPYPVRCAIGVTALATKGMLVEVTAMAARRQEADTR